MYLFIMIKMSYSKVQISTYICFPFPIGDKVLADGFVFKANSLVIDESSLTGET